MKNDMIIYQNKLKENIKQFISENRIDEAKEILNQYENIVSHDIDIYSIKGVVAMMEGNMGGAEETFLKGLNFSEKNFDLLYNLGYLYQANNKNELAIEYYTRALQSAENKKNINEVYEVLKTLGVKEGKEELFESCKSNLNVEHQNKILKNETNNKINELDELENYKIQFKSNIQILVEQGLLEEAKNMVDEYETVVRNDIDIYSIRGVMAMMEGYIDRAEDVFKTGLGIDTRNFNLLYNLAYLYQSNEQNELAIEYYKRAMQNASSEEDIAEVYKLLQELGVNDSKEEILENATADTYYVVANKFEKENNKSDAALNYGLAYRYAKNKDHKNSLMELYNHNKALKDIFDVAAKSVKKRFIILSSCGWGDVYQRMHHIARSLVKFGNDVNYITPAIVANMNDSSITTSDLTRYSFKNSKIVDGVKIYSPIQAICNEKQIANNYIDIVQCLLNSYTDAEQTVIITYMPYQIQVINSLKGNFTHIYECVDDHSDLEYAFWGSKKDVVWEQELMDRADAITTTATSLFLQRRAIEDRENVYLSRNAVNESDFIFTYNENIPEDLKNIPEPRIAYIGAIYEWFDIELFYNVVKSNPDKSFIIIGFGKDEIFKEIYPNLYILGVKKHSELKNYLKYMNIGIIPFKADTDIIINCDPIKQYEYIACGLPVITTYMPESSIGKINTFLADTKETFNEAIEKCISLHIDRNSISRFLTENSWNARAALLCKLADKSITKEEEEKTLTYIEGELCRVVDEYYSSTFKALKATYLNLINSSLSEKLLQEAYDKNKSKYIERQYLTLLLKNQKINKFLEVVYNSAYINEEIKQELLFAQKRKDFKAINYICYICTGDLRKALKLVMREKNNNIKFTYKIYIDYMLGEKIASEKLNSISGKNQNSPLIKFLKQIKKVKEDNESIEDIDIYIADIFNNISQDFIKILTLNNIKIKGLCSNETGLKNGIEKVILQKVVDMQKYNKVKIIVPYNLDYVKQIRVLAEKGIEECEIAVVSDEKVIFINVDNSLMKKIRNKEYNETITLNKFNAADSNIHALIKYIPEQYKKKYKLNVIYGRDVWSIENIVKVPLISNVTVSGFATFLYNYPKLTYNIEVGHSGVPLKACGLMDKKDKKSGGNQELYKKADCICVASHLHMILRSAFYGIPEDKYQITGLPRNDMLALSNNKCKLEKLLGINLKDKKVIFNMPTFHTFDQLNRIEGSSKLNDSVKITDFDYERFNNFLKDNNLICVSKVHHGEEESVSAKTKHRKYDCLFFITNKDLDNKDLDLYEILGAGDILITDYSTVYNDFCLWINQSFL